MNTKTCTKCKETKELTEFAKSSQGKYGVTSVCKECKRAYNKEHYAPGTTAHEEKKVYLRNYRLAIKEKVFDHYGRCCACCGESGSMFLTLDHINNDGSEHRKAIGATRQSSTDKVWRWVVTNDFPEGFQILCYNCNCAKRDNGGVCPHIKD